MLLIGLVLIQPGKGDIASGMSGIGGQFASQMGMRRAADLIVKMTIGFAGALMLFSLLGNKFFAGSSSPEEVDSKNSLIEGATIPAAPTAPKPAGR